MKKTSALNAATTTTTTTTAQLQKIVSPTQTAANFQIGI